MSNAATAHGMGRERVKPDWPPLTLEEARALLLRFPGMDGPFEILTTSPRPFSAASLVGTANGRVFIKRHHRSVRDREGLLEEHRFMAHLRDHGAAVPRLLADDRGGTAIEMGEWTYEVHEATDGIDIYQDAVSWTPFRCASHAHEAGQALARLHLAAQGFDAPRRKQQPLVSSFTIFAAHEPATAMKNYLQARPALHSNTMTRKGCDEALQLLAPFHAKLLPLQPELEPLWTHNDLHASNLLWSSAGDDAQVAAIIDFGLSDRTNAVHDLATALERNCIEWIELAGYPSASDELPVHLDHLLALIDAYHAVRPLSDAEAAALAPMLALCHAEFALSEAEYFLDVTHSEANARLAIEGYLVGHAQWFHGAAGRRLLAAIDAWAATRDSRRLRAAS